MYHAQHASSRLVIAGLFVMLLLTAARSSAAGLVPRDGWGTVASVQAGTSPTDDPLSRLAHRLAKRAENTTLRLGDVFRNAGVVWVSLLASAVVFFLVAAVSSAADFRMLALRHQGLRAISRYIGHGTLTFFRILRDRHTPNIARLILVGALVYWLFPPDLIPDDSWVPGFVDDVLVAVLAAKAFVYLCPDQLVARHAAAVEAHA